MINIIKWWRELDDIWKSLFSINHVYQYNIFNEQSELENQIVGNPFKSYKASFLDDFNSYRNIDAKIFSEMQALSYFYASECGLSSIAPMLILKNLKKIDLSFNSIDNFSPLTLNKNLEKLNIEQTNVNKLDFLSTFKNLRILFLRNNNIKNISPLLSLAKLQVLDISYNDVVDIQKIGQLDHLKSFYCSVCNIENGDFIGKIKSLEFLELSYNNIIDVNFLFTLPKLAYIDIFQNPFDISIYNWKELEDKGITVIKGNEDIDEDIVFY